jgi:predicted acyl esterase
MAEVDFEKQEQALLARAAAFRAATALRGNKSRVVNEAAAIFSDGVRMAGTVWRPDTQDAGDKLPAILLCHGWGGKRAHLDFSYAPKFAAAGFVVLTFDYRGWGDSAGYVLRPRGGELRMAGTAGSRPARCAPPDRALAAAPCCNTAD